MTAESIPFIPQYRPIINSAVVIESDGDGAEGDAASRLGRALGTFTA